MPERILVIDDEVDMLFLLRTIIEDNTDYEVETSNSPLEGVKLLEKKDFDLIITDLKMPVMDGIDIFVKCQKIRCDVPIIIITAYGSAETAGEALEIGVADFIAKPFRKDSILFTIKRVLELSQLKRENIALRKKLNTKDAE